MSVENSRSTKIAPIKRLVERSIGESQKIYVVCKLIKLNSKRKKGSPDREYSRSKIEQRVIDAGSGIEVFNWPRFILIGKIRIYA